MSGGMAAVLSRVSQLESLVTPRRAPAAAAATAAAGARFDQVLGDVSSVTLDSATGGIGALPGSGDGTAGASGAGVVDIARRYLGTPYKWGGTDPDTGLDCSGLTRLVYRQAGVSLPRVSRDQAKAGTEVPSLAQAKPGDLVFFGSPVHHVGIYVGDGKMLDAPHTGAKVRIEKLWGTPSSIRRVLPESGAPATQPAGGTAVAAASRASALTAAMATTATTGTRSGALSGPYADLFTAAGRRHGVDPALLSAVAKAESGYDARAVSGAGARGLMQLMPGTARGLGVDPMDPKQAVDGAARLLKDLLGDFGRTDLALAGYNAGPGAVRRYGGIPPYEETRTYVSRVTGYWKALS